MRRIRDLITSITVTAALAGCGGGEQPKAAEGASKTSYTCKIFVAKKAEGEFKADASDADPAKAEEAAWTAVCAKLPEADRASCRDDKKFTAQKVSASASAGGPTTHTVSIELKPIAPEFDGEGTSDESQDKACAAALEAACSKAGEKGDCVAGGKFQQNGKSTSKKTVKAT
jgi:hypothetical protein